MTHKTVRALARGIQILRVLQCSSNGSSLNDLYKITKISRPTLLRLIATLEQEELIWRRVSTGQYMVSSNLNMMHIIPDPHIKLAEVAAPILRKLIKKIIWPSDLTVLDPQYKTCMYAIDSSRPGTPFPVEKRTIGQSVSLLWTAVGRAYLSFCPEKERSELISILRASRQKWDRIARDQAKIDQFIKLTRSKGYAVRDQKYLGGHYTNDFDSDDRLSAIAVPIMNHGQVIACLNVVWLRGVHSEADIIASCLPCLRDAATEIARAYKARHGR